MILPIILQNGFGHPQYFHFTAVEFSWLYIWVFPKIGVGPQIIHVNRVFHYKPSILGYPYFWKHPYKGHTPSTITPTTSIKNPPVCTTKADGDDALPFACAWLPRRKSRCLNGRKFRSCCLENGQIPSHTKPGSICVYYIYTYLVEDVTCHICFTKYIFFYFMAIQGYPRN